MGTLFEVTHVNQDGTSPQPAQLQVIDCDKIFIVLDYHAKGERGNDKSRDIIKFVTPTYSKGKTTYDTKARNLIAATPKMKTMAEDAISADFGRKVKNNTAGVDTLTPIKWKGICADNIRDAYNKVKLYLGDTRKVKTIVIRTHGGVHINKELVTIGMIVDNNWEHLSDEEKLKSGSSESVLTSQHLEYYKEKKDLTAYPDIEKNIKALVAISNFVQNEGDFVIGSCHSAYKENFISPLQQITNARVNIYGVYGLSSFPFQSDLVVDYKVTSRINNGVESLHLDIQENSSNNGTAYITRKKVFSNTSILSKEGLNGQPTPNYAWKFPAGVGAPIKLDDLGLTENGITVILAS